MIELAKAKQPKPQPTIVTLPQTPEAEQLEEWLSVAPITYATLRPDYSKLTVKQLRQEAKIRNVKNAGVMAKKELIAALQAA